MRNISQSVTIFLRKPAIIPARNAFNLLRPTVLSGNPDPIAGHNKNEFP